MTACNDISKLCQPCHLGSVSASILNYVSFPPIKAILRPVLTFMKDHKQWNEIGLSRAIHTFEAIMYSIQSDISHIVIERLMSNLSLPMNDIVQTASMAIVLSR